MKMDKLTTIEESMEKSFRNAGGDGQGGWSEEYEDFSFGEYGERNATGPGTSQKVSKLNALARVITIVITNTNATVQNVTIFNCGDGARAESTTNIPTGCTVTLSQGSGSGSSYSQLLTYMLESPSFLKGMKMSVNDVDQFDQVITLGYRNPLGKRESYELTPTSYTNSYQNVPTRIEVEDFEFNVNLESFLTIPVLGTDDVLTTGGRVTMTFFLHSQVQVTRGLFAQPSVAATKEGFITGLPKQEILIKQSGGGQGRIG